MGLESDYSDGVPHISYCLTTLDGTVLAEDGADTAVYAASTIKLAVLVAVLRAVDAGRLTLDQELVSTLRFRSAAASGGFFEFEPGEIDDGMPAAGRPVSLRDVLERMIAVSSNEATNMAVELVGLSAVAEALALCGAPSSFMQRLFGDLDGLQEGLTQQTTARDLCAILRSIVTGSVLAPASTALAVSFLEAQQYGMIGPALPGAATWGSKSGWVTAIRHDVALVRPVAAQPFVLAVCTRAYGEDEATAVIAAVTRLAWQIVEAGALPAAEATDGAEPLPAVPLLGR
ncbi:serine hydrolase [Arthrobacter antioxidans]|uniref:serine hydrolase n=1 Tax=Arthrobacter antioxidans TaxID=2895818 RepID=UPI001FFFC289|nr:serine hydrolase [Arthrobacter antioxidans]